MKISRRQVVWRRDADNSRRKSVTGIRFVVVIVVSALCTSGIAIAQTAPPAPPHVPLQKTIGGVSKPEVVPSLIVLNSQGVSLQGNKLVLAGVAPNSIVFADRPVRAAGHDTTSHIIDDWATGSDNFAKDPPNATVSAFSKDGSRTILAERGYRGVRRVLCEVVAACRPIVNDVTGGVVPGRPNWPVGKNDGVWCNTGQHQLISLQANAL